MSATAASDHDVIRRPDHFSRVTVPGATAVAITDFGDRVICCEGTAKPSLGQLGLRVLDPLGRPVPGLVAGACALAAGATTLLSNRRRRA